MKKINDTLNSLGFIATKLSYLLWGIFLLIPFPIMNYYVPSNSFIGRIRFPLSIYAGVIGLLYLISFLYLSKRKSIGLKIAIIPNILGIPFLMPILLGIMSLYYFTRPKIKGQFT